MVEFVRSCLLCMQVIQLYKYRRLAISALTPQTTSCSDCLYDLASPLFTLFSFYSLCFTSLNLTSQLYDGGYNSKNSILHLATNTLLWDCAMIDGRTFFYPLTALCYFLFSKSHCVPCLLLLPLPSMLLLAICICSSPPIHSTCDRGGHVWVELLECSGQPLLLSISLTAHCNIKYSVSENVAHFILVLFTTPVLLPGLTNRPSKRQVLIPYAIPAQWQFI